MKTVWINGSPKKKMSVSGHLLGLVRTMVQKAGVPLVDAVRMMTLTPAQIIGLGKKKGSIEAGKKADLVILNTNTPSLMPNNNLIAGIAYSANGSEVETVIIDGKITMENRQVLTMDEEKIYYEINRIISRMGLDKKVY